MVIYLVWEISSKNLLAKLKSKLILTNGNTSVSFCQISPSTTLLPYAIYLVLSHFSFLHIFYHLSIFLIYTQRLLHWSNLHISPSFLPFLLSDCYNHFLRQTCNTLFVSQNMPNILCLFNFYIFSFLRLGHLGLILWLLIYSKVLLVCLIWLMQYTDWSKGKDFEGKDGLTL